MKTETIDFKVAHLRNFDPIGKQSFVRVADAEKKNWIEICIHFKVSSYVLSIFRFFVLISYLIYAV